MIVASMSQLERFNELFSDKKKVDFYSNKIKPKIIKEFKLEGIYPSWKWREYLHSDSKNKYIVFFYAANAKMANNPETDSFVVTDDKNQKIIIKQEVWPFVLKTGETIGTRSISYFRSHFFKRYRERVWASNDKLSYYELICRFFTRNKDKHIIELNEEIKKDYSDYGEYACQAFSVRDGLCLITFWNEGDISTLKDKKGDFINVVLYETILSHNILKTNQIKALFEEDLRYTRNLASLLLKGL